MHSSVRLRYVLKCESSMRGGACFSGWILNDFTTAPLMRMMAFNAGGRQCIRYAVRFVGMECTIHILHISGADFNVNISFGVEFGVCLNLHYNCLAVERAVKGGCNSRRIGFGCIRKCNVASMSISISIQINFYYNDDDVRRIVLFRQNTLRKTYILCYCAQFSAPVFDESPFRSSNSFNAQTAHT